MRPPTRSLPLIAILLMLSLAVAQADALRIFAAASLTEAFQEIATLYRAQYPGDTVEFNFAGSQILRTQIEEGAPADVFASADHVQMDAMKRKNLVGPDSVFARNRLVVVTPRKSPKVRELADLARPGVRFVIADGNVPVGRYTAQALEKMTRAGLFGEDFQMRVMANIVSQETSVRAVLAKVSLDEVDAGIVYATDARTAAEKVLVLQIPDRMNVVAEYPIAVVASGAAKSAASRFVALVLSDSGQAVLAKRGFEPAR
jgi:molybdate transport system substrate-binding protein